MYKLILIIIITVSLQTTAQMHDNFWYFGYGSLIEFVEDSLICLEGITCKSNKSSVTYSDINGSLLFYGNGRYIYRADNSYITNSELDVEDYIPDSTYSSGYTQGCIALPKPGSSKLVYIINNTSEQGNTDYMGFAYSIYNSELLDGLGDIDTNLRNIHLLDDYIGYSISAVRHGNGRDWWLMMHQVKLWEDTTNLFISFLIGLDSIEGTYYQSVGLLNNRGRNNSQMVFNKTGDKLVYYGADNYIEIFNFNRCNGELSEFVNFQETFEPLGKAFSADGTKLYVGSTNTGKVYQYDLTSGTTGDEIKESRKLVYTADDEHEVGLMAVGPDDKIYFTTYYPLGPETPSTEYNTYLNVIHNPNVYGAACNVEEQAVWLCEGIANIGLPNMPNYRLGVLQGSECDTINTAITQQTKPEIKYNIYPNPASNYLQVETSQAGNHTIIIRDIKGSICYAGNFNNRTQIPVTHFAEGVFSITIVQSETGAVWSDKFVKMD